MRIAILGSSSQIAKDLIISIVGAYQGEELCLFARRPAAVENWLASIGIPGRFPVADYTSFGSEDYDAVINFIGVGDPAKATAMGALIFDVTLQYDQLVLEYLIKHPVCRYLFLSSGAAYGGSFQEPVQQKSKAAISLNGLHPQEWYGIAKLYSECRHRALPDKAIIDIRIFNYFSRTQDLSARFLLSDIIRNILNKSLMETSSNNVMRDYLHPGDFIRLVRALLSSPRANTSLDCYSLAPIGKNELLSEMQREFGLRYKVVRTLDVVNATGTKPCYYSLNKRAMDFGYVPTRTSLAGIIEEGHAIIKQEKR